MPSLNASTAGDLSPEPLKVVSESPCLGIFSKQGWGIAESL